MGNVLELPLFFLLRGNPHRGERPVAAGSEIRLYRCNRLTMSVIN